jgi:hypothetical protein
MTDDKDISNIIAGSELRDMAEFLTNPANKITDCIMCYQSEDDIGYRALSGSSVATLSGLLRIYGDMVRSMAAEMIREDDDAK